MIHSELVTETLLLSKQSSNEDRKSIIKGIEQQMKYETSPNVIAFFDWYISVLRNWTNERRVD